MREVFKILLLCLISVFIASLTNSLLFISVVCLVFVVFLYDFDYTTQLEHHAINRVKYLYLKVRNLYAAIRHREPNNSSFQFTPTMNSVNKQSTSFDLSRFNKSGNAVSPISNNSSSSRRLIQSRQTSTPLTRTTPWQKSTTSPMNIRTPVIHNSVSSRSPRYSLASFSPKSLSNESPSKPTIQTVTGPLLASTRFNVNLGTYTDSKSPGLASRVVQYHNELSGSQTSTHQAKYGSPGLFPIVQLYKKELPILSRSPRRCTVRIAPPDALSCNPEVANTVLWDSFVQNNTENANRQNDTEINTRSVLEALKEISRKRIHTSDDEDEISKRQRKNSVSSSSSSSIILNKDGKRMREDTPPKPKESCTTPINSTPKRICVVNEIESSLSSSRLMRLQQGQKRKSTLDIPEKNKQRRITNGELVSKETQTVTNTPKSVELQNTNKDNQKTTSTAAQTESTTGNGMIDIDTILSRTRRKKKPTEIRSTRDIDEENSTLPFAKISDKPSKPFFSEAPLEIMRQNKLNIMLSALGGNEPEIIPLPDMTLSALKKKSQDSPAGTDIIGKEVVSILSPKNKAKHDKHVTFDIPNTDSTDSTQNQTEKGSVPDVIAETTSNIPISNPDKVSFSSPSTSINFSSPQRPISSLQYSPSAVNPLQYSPSGMNSLQYSPSAMNSSLPISSITGSSFTFGAVSSPGTNPTSSTTTTNSTNMISSSNIDKPENSVNFGSTAPNFSFGGSNPANSPAFGGQAPSSNVPKADTNKPAAVPASAPAFQFTPGPAAPTTSPGSAIFGSSSPVAFKPNTSQPAINFGAKTDSPKPASVAVTTAASSINFGAPNNQVASPSLPPNPSFNSAPVPTTTTSGGMFSFAAKPDAKPTSSNFSFGSSAPSSPPKAGGFKFDLGKTSATTNAPISKSDTPKPPMFGAGSSALNKSGAFTFGAPSTTTLNSGLTTTTTNSTPVFGIPTTSNVSAFGTTNKTVGAGMFGTPATTASAKMFGTPATTASTKMFGAPATTANAKMFGTPATTTSAGVFGIATTTSGATFGTPTTTSGTTFGTPSTLNSGTFGTPTTTVAFGSSNAAPSNSGIFGNTTSTFGTPKTSENTPNLGFGTATTQNPNFGSGSQTTFGFGAPTTTQSNVFGTTTPATTSNNFNFGANTTTKAFAFGGATATTTAPPAYGSTNSTPSGTLFGGTSSGFSGTTNAFGAATTTSQNTFGQQSTSGVFGTAPSNFGAGTSAPAFGTSNTFGASNTPGVFGTSSQQPSTFSSGTNPPNPFATNNNQSGVFGAGNSNNPGFGSNPTGSFGGGFPNNNNAQSAGGGSSQSSGVFTFGVAAPPAAAAPGAPNAFQFGTAQNAKQSGFNFAGNANPPNINFGAAATPSFSATPTPGFGGPVPGQFSAPTPATGMFNIGSGSTAPKQRPIIKARRRN